MVSMGGIAVTAMVTMLPAALRVNGPGRVDDESVQRVLIFDAGNVRDWGDALTHFYTEDLAELDWLRDYVMDTALVVQPDDHVGVFKVGGEEEDELYVKDALTNIEADSGWADT